MKSKLAWKYCRVDGVIEKEMPIVLAKRIKRTMLKGCSWRGLAYTITEGKDSNQLLGMWLFEEAGRILKEDTSKWWNVDEK